MKFKTHAIVDNGKIINRYSSLDAAQRALYYRKIVLLNDGKIIELDNDNRWEKIIDMEDLEE